uniref:WGS project CAEQ00000000 data, annotated contig 1995 n=1 Tax=Trypanosoma congolense (strain IL3000) TaxID=1068625 RepID=F9WAN1_TRYCI|nr:unnamed protein product [Trypanosoma congolense IL3000]
MPKRKRCDEYDSSFSGSLTPASKRRGSSPSSQKLFHAASQPASESFNSFSCTHLCSSEDVSAASENSNKSAASAPFPGKCRAVDGSQNLSEGAFETDLSFFCREEEEIADMCMYLAHVVSSSRTPEALTKLVQYFLEHSQETVMSSLKRAGLQPQLFSVLCKASAYHITGAKEELFIRFVAHLVALSEEEVLSNAGLVEFFLGHVQQRGTTPITPTPKVAHWSQRTKVQPPKQSEDKRNTELQEAIAELCGGNCTASAKVLSLRALLELIFRQNRVILFPGDNSACLVFADMGGFEVVTQMLEEAECEDALHLLEVVTLCEELCKLHQDRLQQMILRLVQLITKEWKKNEGDRVNLALRVLTNSTNLLPHALSGAAESADRTALVSVTREILMDQNTPMDRLAFALCFATNIAKWEVSVGRDEFISSLVDCPSFLPRIAELTIRFYNSNKNEQYVIAGYYALLLAVLSLCDTTNLQLRVPVITSIAQATKGTLVGKSTASKPMTLIVVILQEFVLFQSSAHSLTKEGLIAMNNVIERVMERNGIEVTPEG